MMTVYVDELQDVERSCKWPYRQSCHMLADTTDELNAMADALGLKRSWIQSSGKSTEHYDLNATKREQAIKNGAVAIPWRELVAKVRAKE